MLILKEFLHFGDGGGASQGHGVADGLLSLFLVDGGADAMVEAQSFMQPALRILLRGGFAVLEEGLRTIGFGATAVFIAEAQLDLGRSVALFRS